MQYGVLTDSTWSLHGLHGNSWVSVKYSILLCLCSMIATFHNWSDYDFCPSNICIVALRIGIKLSFHIISVILTQRHWGMRYWCWCTNESSQNVSVGRLAIFCDSVYAIDTCVMQLMYAANETTGKMQCDTMTWLSATSLLIWEGGCFQVVTWMLWGWLGMLRGWDLLVWVSSSG